MVLKPKDEACRITQEDYGQRQTVLFEAVLALGVERYKFMRRNFATGKVTLDLGRALRADTVQLKSGGYILITEEGKG